MSLAKRIKERRIDLGMSQDELAKKLGYRSRSSIAKIEQGKNDIPQAKIKLFADALQCTDLYLMEYVNEPHWTDIFYIEPDSITPDEYLLMTIFRRLNDWGKSKALDLIGDLAQEEEYTENMDNEADDECD